MKKAFCFIMVLSTLIGGCATTIPPDALQLHPESLANRQIQTRRFSTTNYESMLTAATSVLQDLGFTLEESEFKLGVLVGSKKRDATSGAQVAGAIAMALFFGVAMPIDSHQTIRASLVMRQLNNRKESSVRVTFQHAVYDTNGNVSLLEQINDPEMYQKFFDQLSKSVFLEAHEL